MPPLLDRLAENSVGGVFPAKLHLDGTMQEAGAFVTGDANAYVFGDGEAADEPAFAFSREVDFGSAAAMCLTRTTFESVSGFDSAYRYAYFEDADLCFRLRSHGLRLLYEPRSRVIHARGVATPSAAVNEIYASNREVFLRRWSEVIKGRAPYERIADDETARISARDVHAHPRLLIIDGASDSLMQAACNLALTYPRARVTLLAGTDRTATRGGSARVQVSKLFRLLLGTNGSASAAATTRTLWRAPRGPTRFARRSPEAVVLSSTAELKEHGA